MPLSLGVAIALSFGSAAAPAGAVVSGNFGQQLRAEVAINTKAPLQYHGGPVLHSSDSYAIYWDPTGTYRGDWKQLINGYLQGVGADSGTLGNVFALNGQYRDGAGQAANASTFRGSFTATDSYPTTGNCSHKPSGAPTCLTDQQVQTELQHVISLGALPGATGTPVYYVLTPPGVTVCTDGGSTETCSDSSGSPLQGICGYHSAINPGGVSPTVYAVQPWVAGEAGRILTSEPLTTAPPTADVLACQNDSGLQEPNQLGGLNPFGDYEEGLADVIINDLSIEQSNVVVDPLLNGWYQNSTNAEQGDMCQWNFGPAPKPPPIVSEEQQPAHAGLVSNESIHGRSYYLQWAFDSVGVTAGKGISCWSGVTLVPHYTSPNPVNAGDVVGFDATESNITLDAHTQGLPADEPFVAPVYSWDFGDGARASGTDQASAFHSYQYGGVYNVTLTVTDSSANSNSFSASITVVGPPRPGSGSSVPGAASTTSTSSGSGGGGGGGGLAKAHAPVASQTVMSRNLSKVLRGGLLIRYSVNEQVAGRFEVLLASSIARKLGLHGARATGLANGTPPQTVVAKAILVTTKGGHSTYNIKFGKTTAAHLRRLRKVTLMIRLAVHNASSPTVTTVLSTVNLAH
jgi:PKD domain